MTYPRPFRAGLIEPIVEVGQRVLLVDREAYNLYMVAFIEPIPMSGPIILNGGAILAGATTASTTSQPVLDNNYGQFAQLRARVLDDIAVTVLQPQALARFTMKNVNAVITPFTALNDPDGHMTEFYIYEDDRIFVQIRNPHTVNLAQSRIAFWGFKYVLSGSEGPAASGGKVPPLRRFLTIPEAEKSGERYTVIPVGGWGR